MYIHYGLLVVAVFSLGLGLFILVKPDMMWRFTQWRNRASGIATSERGTTWERMNRILGFVVVMAGVFAAFGFWQFAQIVAEEEARQERARDLPPPSFDDLNLFRPTESP